MPPVSNSHKRSHSLLLLQKLLNMRDPASPLTLLLDSLEQAARPVVTEIMTRAKIARTKTIFLSFSTLRRPRDADVFIKAAGRDMTTVRRELLASYPVSHAGAKEKMSAPHRPAAHSRAVVVIDSLNALASSAPQSLAMFLSSIITPAVSVVAVYHEDAPLVLPRTFSEYEPHPFALLCHLATAILRLSSLEQQVERQRARDRSLQEPEWGLREGREGVLMGLVARGSRAVVINMELRRRSGRAVSEAFVLEPADGTPGRLGLLADHEGFARPEAVDRGEDGEDDEPASTFDLGLTEKQRRDREGIVLPYFDAQTDIGAGEGGRILYEMGREDDFDDEEDEI